MAISRCTVNCQKQQTAERVSTGVRLVHINGIDGADGEERVVVELVGSKRVARRIPETSAGNAHALISSLTNVDDAYELVAR